METVRRALEPWLTGRIVLEAQLVDAPPGPKYARLELAIGRRIASVGRRGKFLVLPLERSGAPGGGAAPAGVPGAPPGAAGSAPLDLVVHLGMTGVLSSEPPPAHLRVRLRLSGGAPEALYFRDARRFGRFLVAERGVYEGLPTLRAMGPDALSPAFSARALRRSLRRSEVAIKTALMAQRAVAGIGNIYADEALWRAGLHPLRPARSLRAAEAEALTAAIREVLHEAIEAQGTTLADYRTVEGSLGAYGQRLAVYGRTGDVCGRCGGTIERIVVGARGTHICPRCQPAPRRGRAVGPRRATAAGGRER